MKTKPEIHPALPKDSNKYVENIQEQTNNRIKKQNNFRVKHGHRKNITEKLNG